MNIKYISFEGISELLDIVHSIRKEVFVVEQQIDAALEFDGIDAYCTHYIAYIANTPIATCRLRTTNDGIKLERFAVLKEFRNKGIGKLLLEKILNDIIPQNKIIYLNSQVSALNFYKNNNFTVVGNKFYEADIEHYKMIYQRNRLLD